MNSNMNCWHEFDELLDRVLDELHSEEDARRLNVVLRDSREARERYITYAHLHGRLTLATKSKFGRRETLAQAGTLQHEVARSPVTAPNGLGEESGSQADALSIAPIVIDLGETNSVEAPLFGAARVFLPYGISAIVLIVGLLLGWLYHPAFRGDGPNPLATVAKTELPEPIARFVGRVTGAIDCHWPEGAERLAEGDFVPQNRRYVMLSGLLEVAYNSGDRVILQGPCSYEAESENKGFLSVGKVTVRVAKAKSSKVVATKPAAPKTQVSDAAGAAQRAPLFTIRTPTLVVTDLGTEFGVEVDKTGSSKAHVFSGKVEVRQTDPRGTPSSAIILGANESVQVTASPGRNPTLVRGTAQPTQFVLQLPRRVPIKVFNTGVGLKEGDTDPHWQVVARSDDTGFKQQQAVVTPICTLPQPNGSFGYFQLPNSATSSWVSTSGKFPFFPGGVTYTFRITFDLDGMLPGTASLQGKFIADDRVTAIRLNGRSVELPPCLRDGPLPFLEWLPFNVNQGFVPSTNVLEFDVQNAEKPSGWTGLDLMALRVELKGSAVRQSPADPKGEVNDGAQQRVGRSSINVSQGEERR